MFCQKFEWRVKRVRVGRNTIWPKMFVPPLISLYAGAHSIFRATQLLSVCSGTFRCAICWRHPFLVERVEMRVEWYGVRLSVCVFGLQDDLFALLPFATASALRFWVAKCKYIPYIAVQPDSSVTFTINSSRDGVELQNRHNTPVSRFTASHARLCVYLCVRRVKRCDNIIGAYEYFTCTMRI